MNYVEQIRERFSYVMTMLVCANVALLAMAPATDGLRNPGALMIFGIALAGIATFAQAVDRTHWLTRQVGSVAALGQVMLLVYAYARHPYQVDMHMYFFATLALLSGWLDWRIFVTATIAIAAHHGGLSLLYADAVFPGGSDDRRVLIHAVIVVVQATALGWIVEHLKSAFETSAREREGAIDARLATQAAERELAEVTRQAAIERRGILFTVADDFEQTIAGIAKVVLSSVEALRAAARQMTLGAKQVAEGASTASQSSLRASANVMAVTQATDDLRVSIGEIEKQVTQASRIVNSTTMSADAVATTVHRLLAKADDIDSVVELISTIADHTNLLALNAAIEAARHGASGNGFMVVAQEVKALAGQTSQATETIQSQIEAIRTSSGQALHAIGAMNDMIGSLNDISLAVAIVVEQQSEATAGIARTFQIAAQETVSVSGTIEVVDEVAMKAGSAAGFIAASADALAIEASRLDGEVTQFLARIRAA